MTEHRASLRLIDGHPEQPGIISRAELLGQGLFETLRWNGERFPLLSFHEARLKRGADWLGYDSGQVISSFRSELAVRIEADLPKQPASVRFQWSHQQLERGYASHPGIPVTLWQWSTTVPEPVRTLKRLALAEQPIVENPGPAVKHTSRVDQVVAADRDGAAQIRCDRDGYLREGLSGNLVFWRHGQLCAPSLERHGVQGTLLNWLLDFARVQGWPVIQGDLPPAALQRADAALVLNALGAQVVNEFAGSRYNLALPQLTTTLQAIRQLLS
ncbi:MAG: aminotransferase class IV [Natronospirillum sp.]|uniref:aminotransferase class IV n=1 Tax=Natronospirillum sp. TaxID=2812955 RepID=UPI0025EEF247|nr:aminotransferase class IV [Natronospirillum sp.]MCH8551024.1 aminotransferase class IV [Natronospirillum sp.]